MLAADAKRDVEDAVPYNDEEIIIVATAEDREPPPLFLNVPLLYLI